MTAKYSAYKTCTGWHVSALVAGKKFPVYLYGRKNFRWFSDYTYATDYSEKTAKRIVSDLREGRLTV